MKWKTLKHNGPAFAPPYEPRNFELTIKVPDADNPIKVRFLANAEEMLYHWAAKINTQYVKDPVFQKNFFHDIKEAISIDSNPMPHEALKANFPDGWDFSPIVRFIERQREAKKNRSREEKDAEKRQKEERKEKYGYATLDSKKIEIANYIVEPPGIFMGRGENPLRGRWKHRMYPTDIVLNLGENAPVPKPDPNSQGPEKWKEIVHNHDAMWLAYWRDKLTGDYKYVMPSPKAGIRQQNDINKFEKAMQLIEKMPDAIAYIDKCMKSRNKKTRETATVCSLIAHLGIRVGDEKDEDEAETYGATTLLAKHVSIKDKNVQLNFLGKDSILYKEKVELPDLTIQNLQKILASKKPKEQIFNTTSKEVNELLGQFLPGLTAKVFRTAIATAIMRNYLDQYKDKNLSERDKIKIFKEANILVAQKLNHRKTPTESALNSVEKKKTKIAELKKELSSYKEFARKEIDKLKKIKQMNVKTYKGKYKGIRLREAVSRANSQYKKKKTKIENKLNRLQERKDKLEFQLDIQQKTLKLNLTTSLNSYVNPRITFSWAKGVKLELKHIYTKANIEKFTWASK